ncbi:hypothetical protein LCGC14_2677840 [marine sediment metagenome]|uniref:Uncharacterized protein n=1 Tax=marine sediment metagenome TaxID=412755 RepID=A0A0F9BX46_9ZZZZ
MKIYSAYIHTNGTLQVKGMPFGEDLIDLSSPFVDRHLGMVEAEDMDEAVIAFEARLLVSSDLINDSAK